MATKTRESETAGVSEQEAFEIIVKHLKEEEPLQCFFRFGYKANLGNYTMKEGVASIGFAIDPEANSEDILAKGRAAALAAKALVYSELKIDMALEEGEGGTILTEVVRREIPGSEAIDAGSATPEGLVGSTPPHGGMTKDPAERKANKEWAEARYKTHSDEFFDNRADIASGKINAKSPHFKHKTSGVGYWLPNS